MNEFFERLNNAYENELKTASYKDRETNALFRKEYTENIMFRTMVNSLKTYRNESGRYFSFEIDGACDRSGFDGTAEQNAVYLAIINFGK